MSIVSTIYPDPRESERCRLSPEPRRSLPWDVVDDRCDPSVLLETRREPLRKAPAKADSLLSGFGFDPVKKPNIFPKRSPLVSILRKSRSDGKRKGFRSEPLESLTLRSFAIGSFSRRSIVSLRAVSSLSSTRGGERFSSGRARWWHASRRRARRSRVVSALQITTRRPEKARRGGACADAKYACVFDSALRSLKSRLDASTTSARRLRRYLSRRRGRARAKESRGSAITLHSASKTQAPQPLPAKRSVQRLVLG